MNIIRIAFRLSPHQIPSRHHRRKRLLQVFLQREKAGGHGRVARAQGWGGRNCEVVYQAQGRTWCFLLSSRTTVCCPDSLRKWTTMKTQNPGPVPRGASNGKEPQRQELKRCRLENSSAGWLEHGDGHSEPEAEWESSESQCIHNSSSPEPRTKSWDLFPGGEGNLHPNTCKATSVLKRKEKSLWVGRFRSHELGKVSCRRQFRYFKALPRPEQSGPCPCCSHQLEYHRHVAVFVWNFWELKVWGMLLLPVT